MTGFIGMGMVGMAQNGGFGAAQNLYAMGQQQAAAQKTAPVQEGWHCGCGATVTGNFCPECGAKRPEGWTCSCGAVNKGNFCPECGAKKPE